MDAEWPVPVPKGTSLDLIQIEMLNLGAEYAWLDVLCLRQEGGIKEHLCQEEWKVDVPTIGNMYKSTHRVCAWMLQEISHNPTIGGDTGDQQFWEKFYEQLSSLCFVTYTLYDVLSEMQKQVSTNPVDKIAGMTYLLGSDSIPAYYGGQSEENMWTALLDGVLEQHLASLLLWRPSWKQVMSKTVPPSSFPSAQTMVLSPVTEGIRTDLCIGGYIIESALVRGLSKEDSQGREHSLLSEESMQHWVIGWRLANQRFKKASVFELYDKHEEEEEEEDVEAGAYGKVWEEASLMRSICTEIHTILV
ncbi:hypothetical protein F5146DRAFT_1004418 [Armillaria mellea]|nr:hypothetical protein F5146DRAFT_1004418 [Armillaria mellea]